MTTSKRLIKNVLISLFAVIILFPLVASAQDSIRKNTQVPVTKLFYKLPKNIVGSVKYHYGLNYVVAGVATYFLIEGYVDWKWYRFTYRHKWIYNTGYSAVYAGEVIPFAFPLGLYIYGRHKKNKDLQVTALAVGQAALLGVGISSLLKVFTGRVPPTKLIYTDDLKGDFRFGFLQGGANNGWPSSHTTTAFAMATSLIALYPDNTAIKIGALVYASYIGLGVSTNVHWFSDAVAGSLIGWAIGRTVGMSYRNLMNNAGKPRAFNFSVNPLGAAVSYKF